MDVLRTSENILENHRNRALFDIVEGCNLATLIKETTLNILSSKKQFEFFEQSCLRKPLKDCFWKQLNDVISLVVTKCSVLQRF